MLKNITQTWSIFWRMTLFLFIGTLPLLFVCASLLRYMLDPVAFIYAKPSLIYGIYSVVALTMSKFPENFFSRILWKYSTVNTLTAKVTYTSYAALFFTLAFINLVVAYSASTEAWVSFKLASSLAFVALPLYIALFKLNGSEGK